MTRVAATRLAVFAIAVTGSLCGESLGASPPSLQVIRDEYQASLDRLGTVWFQYQQVRTSHVAAVDSLEETCEYAVDGPRHLMLRTSVTLPGRTITGRIVSGCDGTTTWGQVFKSPAVKTPSLVWRRPHDEQDGLTSQTDLAEWTHRSILGLHMNFDGHSIAEETLLSLLEQVDDAPIVEETLGKVPVWRVTLGPVQSDLDPCPIVVTAWFDPRAGYLPRRIVLDSGGYSDPTIRQVDTFQSSPSGVLFPTNWSITLINQAGVIQHVTVTTVSDWKVGDNVDPALFAPRIPRGVTVLRARDRMHVAKELQLLRRRLR